MAMWVKALDFLLRHPSFVSVDLHSAIGLWVSFMQYSLQFKDGHAVPTVPAKAFVLLFLFVTMRSLFAKASDLQTSKRFNLFHACDYICNSYHVDYGEDCSCRHTIHLKHITSLKGSWVMLFTPSQSCNP